MSKLKAQELFDEEDMITQSLDKKIDNQVFKIKQATRHKKVYHMIKLEQIRNALLNALGDKHEIIINQVKMRKELEISLPTWLKHTTTLKSEFEFIRLQRGTLLRRNN